MKKIAIQAATLAITTAIGASALADDDTTTVVTKTRTTDDNVVTTVDETPGLMTDRTVSTPVVAPRKAFELGINTGYTQGFGAIRGGSALGEVGPGFAVGANLGYRVNPRWSMQFSGQYNQFMTDTSRINEVDYRGASFSLGATVHSMPFSRLDPWLSIGSGYRLLWEAPEAGTNVLYHGFELTKLRVGFDFRASRDVAIAPVLGADLDYIPWQKPEGSSNQVLADKRLSTFVFAGVQGRFDMGGTRETRLGDRLVCKR